jgi:uncharacterized protein YhfF
MTDLAIKYPDAVRFKFGDGPDLSHWLLSLVLAGKKTATCMALRDVEEGGEPMPQVGRRDMATDWDGHPVLLIETVEVVQRRFDEVDAEFALAEGENETLEGWRKDHRDYFERNGGWSPDMKVICERFRVVDTADDVEERMRS